MVLCRLPGWLQVYYYYCESSSLSSSHSLSLPFELSETHLPTSPGLIWDVNSFSIFPPVFPVVLVQFDLFLETAGTTLTSLELAKSALKAYHLTLYKLTRDGSVF